MAVRVSVEDDGGWGAAKGARVTGILTRDQGVDDIAIVVVDAPLESSVSRASGLSMDVAKTYNYLRRCPPVWHFRRRSCNPGRWRRRRGASQSE